MAFDGMATPLGMKPGPSRRGLPPLRRWIFVACLFLAVGVVTTHSLMRREPMDPGAVAVIERSIATEIQRQPAAPAEPAAAPRPGEMQNGVNVIRQNGGGVQGMVIRVPDPAERAMASMDTRVAERGQFGFLPRIGEGGLTPRQLYSRPFKPNGKPIVAVVMTGVGVGAKGTADALAKLPRDVSLAFAPYGRDLETQVVRARREGHEVLLQVPMEPHDYPESDPGPHTLRAGADARENLEKLHWLMSRLGGYVGLVNFMGGKLMSTPGPYGSLLEEMNRRGLLFLDDGSNPTSRTRELTRSLNMPAAIGDQVYDASAGRSLDAVLAEIEAVAKRKGQAVITIPTVPANVDKVVAWSREIQARGLVLAPVSAIIEKTR
jgi:polysaccharide deacetylase 2 family uncharacterized protein YibQ